MYLIVGLYNRAKSYRFEAFFNGGIMDYEKKFFHVMNEVIIFLYGKTFSSFKFHVDLKEHYTGAFYYFQFSFFINGTEQQFFSDDISKKNKYNEIFNLNEFLLMFYKRIKFISNINKLYYFHQCRDCGRIFKNPSPKINKLLCDSCNVRKTSTKNKKHIYFFQSCETGLIKIGISGNYERRKRTLELSSGSNLTVLLLIDGDDSTERYLHGMFHEYRTVGEWFQPHEDILKYIENNKND